MANIHALGLGGTSVAAPFVGPAVRARRPHRPRVTRRKAPRARRVTTRGKKGKKRGGKRGQRGGGFNPLSLLPLATMLL